VHAYTHGVSDTPLLGRSIGEDLEGTAARHGGRDALVSCHQGIRLTYAELDAAVDRVARGLLAVGIERGDRVGLWSPNCAEWVLVQYATAKVGAILVNINPAYRTHELAFVLRQAGVRMLVSAPAFKTSDHRAMVLEVVDECPALEHVVWLDSPDWDELQAAGDGVAPAQLRDRMATLAFDDPINIQYTSGTKGFP
jgi:fatty-acyl-CoA synthase